MYKILLEQFIKQFGRVPSTLEKILLKQKALKQSLDQRKVLDMKGNPLDPNKPIIGGTQEFQSGIIKATKQKPTAVKTEAQIKKEIEKQNKESIQRFKDKMKDPEDLAGGGVAGLLGERMGYDNGKIVKRKNEEMGPLFETNDPKEAIKEVIQRLINIDPAKIPLTDKLQLMFDLNRIKAGGSTDLFGGELNFGYNKDFGREGEGFGFEWKKQFAGGGIAGMLGEPTFQDEDHRVPLKKGKTPWKPPQPDENILEGIWKNMGPWEKVLWGLGLSPFEKGGRVDLAGGGLAAALRFLMQKYGKDAIKLLKDVKPSKKWDTQKAIREFKKRNPEFKAEGGRTGFYLGGPVWKKFMEGLFLKASNDIRQGKGLFKGLAQKDWIKLHDDLTKKLVEFQKSGYKRIPKGMKKFFDMNDIQIMNKYKIATGQMKPSFSLNREKLMNRFPNMTKQQVDELMGKTVDEQKEALDQLMKLEKFNPVIKHAEGGLAGMLGE